MAEESTHFDERESLLLINSMIQKARNSYHDTGLGPMLWGGIVTICSLVTWLQLQFNYWLPFDIWLLTFFAIIPQFIIVAGERKRRVVKPYDETTMDWVWMIFGMALFLCIFISNRWSADLRPILEVYQKTTGNEHAFSHSSHFTSIFLMLYGIPTLITGGFRRFRPMILGGAVCWICAIISTYTGLKHDMLLTALSATSAWLIPGIILYRKHRINHRTHV